jgi:hypothetical protein
MHFHMILVAKATPKSPQLLVQGTMLLAHMLDLLLKGFDLPCITTKTAPLSCHDALGAVLQLEQVLSIPCHVHTTTMVVVLKDVACLINACLPLWIRVVLDGVQQDGNARDVRQVLRAQGDEHHVSSLLHGVIHIVSDDPRRPRAPIRKHRVGRDVDVDLIAGQAMLFVEPPAVLGSLLAIASLHEGVPQQHGEAMAVQTPHAQPSILEGTI